jgi:uncharacterized membrane protein YjjB (DUF3815 family)
MLLVPHFDRTEWVRDFRQNTELCFDVIFIKIAAIPFSIAFLPVRAWRTCSFGGYSNMRYMGYTC